MVFKNQITHGSHDLIFVTTHYDSQNQQKEVVSMGELKAVQISEIRENPVALRTVNRESEDYLGLVASMQQRGFMGAITVRPQKDPESEEEYYELIDGLHRFAAAKDAGISEINVDVVDLNDDLVLEAQIMANIHKVETRPAEYTQQLKRILARNPLMTEAELASKLGKSPQWIQQRLSLTKIDNEEIVTLINEGKIGLANAYALAKLPVDEQAAFVDRAITQPPDEFVPAVNSRVKEIREANRKGQDATKAEFQPVAHMRKMKDVKLELDNPEIGPALIKETGTKKPVDAFELAIQWILHLDPNSVEVQKAEYEERMKKKEEAKKAATLKRAKAAKEKADAKADYAAKKAANAEAEAEGKELPFPDLDKKPDEKKKGADSENQTEDAATEGEGEATEDDAEK
jgi:ParB family chromosome partitioning protein